MEEKIIHSCCCWCWTERTEQLGLASPDNYMYLSHSGTYTVEGTDDRQDFQETMKGILKMEEIQFVNERDGKKRINI